MWPSKCRTRSSGRTSTGRIEVPRGRLLAARQAAGPELDRVLRSSQGAGDRVEGFFEGGLRAGYLLRGTALEGLEFRARSAHAAGGLGSKGLELGLEMREPCLELFKSVLRGAPRGTASGFLGHGSSRVMACSSLPLPLYPIGTSTPLPRVPQGPRRAIVACGSRSSHPTKAIQSWSAK